MLRPLARRTPTRLARAAVPLAFVAALATACSSPSTSGSSAAPSASSSAAGSSSAAAGVTVGTQSAGVGTYLTDGAGRALYLFASDTATTSTCNDPACVKAWPPLTSSSTPAVAGNAKADLLGTLTRADGTMQVTYAGHPLYYFVADSAAGMTKGQGKNAFGALWWLVEPSGSAITATATPSTSGY